MRLRDSLPLARKQNCKDRKKPTTISEYVMLLQSKHAILTAVFLCANSALAFTAALSRKQSGSLSNALYMAPLSNEEIFARAQQRKAAEEEEQAPLPMLFDDHMLNDMQAALLLMEKRVTEGPGSLSLLEVDQLKAQLDKITEEMKVNEHNKPPRPPRSQDSASASYPSSLPPQAFASVPAQARATPAVAYSASAPPAPATRVETVAAAPRVIDIDTPLDEGKEYDGHGGMGQAADTTNTYIIPGMDEMSPAEYQKELQRSVIERQARRKSTGVTGNRSSWDYLNSLTGETGVLKKNPTAD